MPGLQSAGQQALESGGVLSPAVCSQKLAASSRQLMGFHMTLYAFLVACIMWRPNCTHTSVPCRNTY